MGMNKSEVRSKAITFDCQTLKMKQYIPRKGFLLWQKKWGVFKKMSRHLLQANLNTTQEFTETAPNSLQKLRFYVFFSNCAIYL
jgi:hypothetical protein